MARKRKSRPPKKAPRLPADTDDPTESRQDDAQAMLADAKPTGTRLGGHPDASGSESIVPISPRAATFIRFTFAVITILPLFLAARLPTVGLEIAPVQVIYFAYHGCNLYNWLSHRNPGFLYKWLISLAFYASITTTVLLKCQLVFVGSHGIAAPWYVYDLFGVPRLRPRLLVLSSVSPPGLENYQKLGVCLFVNAAPIGNRIEIVYPEQLAGARPLIESTRMQTGLIDLRRIQGIDSVAWIDTVPHAVTDSQRLVFEVRDTLRESKPRSVTLDTSKVARNWASLAVEPLFSTGPPPSLLASLRSFIVSARPAAENIGPTGDELGKATSFFRREQYTSAVPILEQRATGVPTDAYVLALLAETYRHLGKDKLAHETARLAVSAMRSETDSTVAAWIRAVYHECAWDWREALSDYKDLLRLEPANAYLTARVIECQIHMDRPEDALTLANSREFLEGKGSWAAAQVFLLGAEAAEMLAKTNEMSTMAAKAERAAAGGQQCASETEAKRWLWLAAIRRSPTADAGLQAPGEDDSLTFWERALKSARNCPSERPQIALRVSGCQERTASDPTIAVKNCNDALEAAKRLGWQVGIAKALVGTGRAYGFRGDRKNAEGHFRSALELSSKLKWQRGVASCMGNLGRLAFEAGDLPGSLDWMKQALDSDKTIGDKEHAAERRANLGDIAVARGSLDEAREWYRSALSAADGETRQQAHLGLAGVFRRRGLFDTAEKEILEARASDALEMFCLLEEGRLALARGNRRVAEMKALQALAEVEKAGLTGEEGSARCLQVRAMLASANATRAEVIEKLGLLAEKVTDRFDTQVEAQILRARLHCLANDRNRANSEIAAVGTRIGGDTWRDLSLDRGVAAAEIERTFGTKGGVKDLIVGLKEEARRLGYAGTVLAIESRMRERREWIPF